MRSGKSKATKTQTKTGSRKATTAARKRTTKSAAAGATKTPTKARRASTKTKVTEPFALVAAESAAAPATPAARPGIRDNVLGRLEWNDELKSYHGKIEYRGQSVDVALIPNDSPESLDGVIDRARDVVSRLDAYVDRAQELAAAKQGEAADGCGCQEFCDGASQQPGEEPVIAQFRKGMRLKSLEFRDGGKVTFLHDDGNSFWGHLIEVTLGADDQLSVVRSAA